MIPLTNNREIGFRGESPVPEEREPSASSSLGHMVRYCAAAGFVAAGKVIDIRCGTGFGKAIPADKTSRVVGIDNTWEATQYAQQHYFQGNLNYASADWRRLPFSDHPFALAILSEEIEHISEQDRCLSEVRRVLAPGGMLILATHNPVGPTCSPRRFRNLFRQWNEPILGQ